LMAYVAEYFHRFASSEEKENSARRCAKFLKFLRDMRTRQNEYEKRANALILFAREAGQKWEDHKFGDSLGEAQKDQSDLRQFVVSVRPGQEGEKMDVESLFVEIQTELKVNNRPAYVPPDGLSPDDVQAAFDNLTKKQEAYHRAVRENRFRFIKKEEGKVDDEKKKEIEESFAHFDANKNGVLDKLEFKAALSAMSIYFGNEQEFQDCFNKVAQGDSKITKAQYLGFVEARYKDRDTPDQIKESFKAVADGNATITAEQLNCRPLTQDDVEYLKSVMTQTSNGGYDYNAFVDSNFVQE